MRTAATSIRCDGDGGPQNIYGQFAKPANYLQKFKEDFGIDIISLTDEELVFDLKCVDASLANALRRILIAEVPTMAIEQVYIQDNSSIIQDEVLAHRLGLIPIKADPRAFNFQNAQCEEDEDNTLVFKLETSYEELEDENEDEMIYSAEVLAPSRLVLSKHLEWEPQGSQSDKFPDGIAPVHDDILIAKLRPGQKLNLEMRCCKGVGATHAKWSPVATATYRLLPQISFKQDVEGELATKLVELCPMNVFDIEDLGGGKTKAVVARERNCSVCRECVREEEWKERVKLERKVDHFIFNVESVGMLPPEVLFLEAFDLLKHKCNVVMGEIGGS